MFKKLVSALVIFLGASIATAQPGGGSCAINGVDLPTEAQSCLNSATNSVNLEKVAAYSACIQSGSMFIWSETPCAAALWAGYCASANLAYTIIFDCLDNPANDPQDCIDYYCDTINAARDYYITNIGGCCYCPNCPDKVIDNHPIEPLAMVNAWLAIANIEPYYVD